MTIVGEGDPETRGTSCAIPSWNVPKSIFWSRSRRKSVTKGRQSVTEEGGDEKVSPKVSLDQSINEKVSPKVSLDQKCHQKLCDLRNRESDQNLSLIKVAGNQKLCMNADFLLIKVQRLQRNSSSKFPSAQWRCNKLHVEKWKSILKTSPQSNLCNRESDQNLSLIKVAGNQKLWTNVDFL